MQNFFDKFVDYLPQIGIAVAVFILLMLLKKLLRKMLKKAIAKSKLDKTVETFFVSLVDSIMLIVIVVVALGILGVSTGSMIAILGTLGVAVGLALKDSLSNVAGGFLIVFSKPFVVGDYVELEGSEGKVTGISIFYTIMKTDDGKMVYLPNGKVSMIKIIKTI
jgi:small conductance mechanosensitive channel